MTDELQTQEEITQTVQPEIEEPQEAKDELEATINAAQDYKDYILRMDPSGISMRIIPRSFVEAKGLEYAFNEKGLTGEELQDKRGPQKEPEIEGYQEAAFNVDYLYSFIGMVKKSISAHITLRVKTGEPICIIAKGDSTKGKEVRFWLAPYMES